MVNNKLRGNATVNAEQTKPEMNSSVVVPVLNNTVTRAWRHGSFLKNAQFDAQNSQGDLQPPETLVMISLFKTKRSKIINSFLIVIYHASEFQNIASQLPCGGVAQNSV